MMKKESMTHPNEILIPYLPLINSVNCLLLALKIEKGNNYKQGTPPPRDPLERVANICAATAYHTTMNIIISNK